MADAAVIVVALICHAPRIKSCWVGKPGTAAWFAIWRPRDERPDGRWEGCELDFMEQARDVLRPPMNAPGGGRLRDRRRGGSPERFNGFLR